MRTRLLLVAVAASALLYVKPASAAVVGDLTGPTADQLRGAAGPDADGARDFDGDSGYGRRDGQGTVESGGTRRDAALDGGTRREARKPKAATKAPPTPSQPKPGIMQKAMGLVFGDKAPGDYVGGVMTFGALGGMAGAVAVGGALGVLGGVGIGALAAFLLIRFLF